MKKMCRRDFLWIAFGAGCVIACCCPTVWITRILAIVVIILGIICCKKQWGSFYEGNTDKKSKAACTYFKIYF